MKRPDYLQQVKKRLQGIKDGMVFVPSDFFDIAEATIINKCLNRLEKTGEIRRIKRGVYAKSHFSKLLKKDILPSIDEIAKAIARNYGWTIVPFGDTALNMLGLSTQVPVVWVYISDGPYKTFEVEGMTLKFKHTDNKNELISISHTTALIVQALKALGKGNATDKELRKISQLLSEEEKRRMLVEAKRVTAWVFQLIRKICSGSSYE
jgi:hypothetical protein